MDLFSILIVTLAASILINTGMFLLAFRFQTDRLTDVSYALTFILLAFYTLTLKPLNESRILLFSMVILWALRLGTFLLIRISRTGIDHRFDTMRHHFWQFAKFWELQAVSVWVILLPTLLALFHASLIINGLSCTGIMIWLAGLIIEGFADIQKFRFSQNTTNATPWIDQGLWHYSRHPNYLGEMMIWIGIYITIVKSLTPLEALLGVLGPVFVVSLLLFVSGIPLLEKDADRRWGADKRYVAYKARTSILLLLPSKSIKK